MAERRITKVGTEVRLHPDRFPSSSASIDKSAKQARVFNVLHYDANTQKVFISFPKEWGGGTQDHIGITETGQYVSVAEDKNNLIPAVALFAIGSKVQLSELYFKENKNVIIAAGKDDEWEILGYYSDYSDQQRAGNYIVGVPQSRGGHRDHKAAPVYGVRLEEKYLEPSTKNEKKKSAEKQSSLDVKNQIEDLKNEIVKLQNVTKVPNLFEVKNEILEIKQAVRTLLEQEEKDLSKLHSSTKEQSTEQISRQTAEQDLKKEDKNMSTSSNEMWSGRVQQAAIRTGVRKISDLGRNTICKYLQSYLEGESKDSSKAGKKKIANTVEGLDSFLRTPMGDAIFSMAIGEALRRGLPYLPGEENDKVHTYARILEEELMVSGMAVGMETILDTIFSTFMPGLQDVISSLPELPVESKTKAPKQQEVQIQETVTVAAVRS